MLPVGGVGDAEAPGEAAGEPDGDGEAEGVTGTGSGSGSGSAGAAGLALRRWAGTPHWRSRMHAAAGLALALAAALAVGAALDAGAALALAAGEPLAPGDPLATGVGDGLGSGRSAICSVLISMKPGAGLDGDRLEALLGEDRLDLVGRDVRVLEADLPLRPARVVDRELKAGVGERGQEDEDEARDGDDQREEIEPAPLPDDVKHARAPRAVRTGGRPRARRTRPRAGPYSDGLRAHSWRTTQRRIVRVTTIALNIETSTPMISTRAKPRMTEEPSAYRMVAVMRLDTFESRIEFQARLKPGLDGRRQRLADPQLLLHPFEDEDVGVDRHADREHEARDPGQGQRHRDEPEDRVHHERVVDEREARDEARQPVVDEHERDDERDPDQAGEQRLVQELARRASR